MLVFAGFKVGIAYVKGNFIVFIKIVPQRFGEPVNVVGYFHPLRLALKGWYRAAVADVGVQEMSESRCHRIGKGISAAA